MTFSGNWAGLPGNRTGTAQRKRSQGRRRPPGRKRKMRAALDARARRGTVTTEQGRPSSNSRPRRWERDDWVIQEDYISGVAKLQLDLEGGAIGEMVLFEFDIDR